MILTAAGPAHRYRAFGAAIVAAGHERLVWDDLEVLSAGFPRPSHGVVVFHGSLGTAERVRRELPWRPGAYCRVEAFACSSWYPRAARWLLHRRWSLTTARDLLRDPEGGTRVVHDRHEEGLFPQAAWEATLRETGFTPEVVRVDHSEVDYPLLAFVGRRPA